MPKNIIFEIKRVNNPLCLLANGKTKDYNSLSMSDNVLVRDIKNSSRFVVGKIVTWKFPRKVWTYEVKTNQGTFWCYPADFKNQQKKNG